MIYLVILLFGILSALIQCTLLSAWLPVFFVPDPILLLVLYVSLALPLDRGLVLSFSLGLLGDILSGAPQGWYALLSLLFFVVNKWILSRVYLQQSPTAFGLFLVDVLLKLAYVVLFKTLSGVPLPGIREDLAIWGGEVVSTFFLMPVLFGLLSRSLGFRWTRFLKTKRFQPT